MWWLMVKREGAGTESQSPRIGIGMGNMEGIGIGDSYRFFKVIYVKNRNESVRIGNIQINR